MSTSASSSTSTSRPSSSRARACSTTRHVLEASGVPAASLQLEVTETALVTNSATVEANFAALRELGVQVAIDDFGTGYASLSYLQRFPITTLKVDRSFVERLGRSPEDYLIVESVIRLAHSLGVTVTAEGIEATDQLAALIELACDRAQGFLFAEPIEPNAFSDALRARPVMGAATLDKVS
jgi:EAL domain-containing protein (putative c-di-GMP-specific phosphodiesterase class I)